MVVGDTDETCLLPPRGNEMNFTFDRICDKGKKGCGLKTDTPVPVNESPTSGSFTASNRTKSWRGFGI